MLQRLLDRFVPVREDDTSWLDHRDGVGVPAAAFSGSTDAVGAEQAGQAGQRTLLH